MHLLITLTATILLQTPPAPLDASQFARVLEGLHGGIKDVMLVFEGGLEFVGPERLYAPRKVRPSDQYQGTYLYRDDGASLLECYNRTSLRPDTPLSILRTGVLRGQLQEQTLSPDRRRANEEYKNSRGSGRSLDMPGSASRIILLWYFQSLTGEANLSEQAWEMVDGHRCLRVRIDTQPRQAGGKKLTQRMWIDMDRGGNPLRIEWLVGEKMDLRTRDIQLDRFPLPDGGHAWLPVSGAVESFVWGDDYFDTPILRETYGVVQGSIRLNQHLTDRSFKLETAAETTGSPFLAKAKGEFEQEVKRKAAEPTEKIDPVSIKARLERELAEADRQAKMLDASSSAASPWNWTSLIQTGLGVLGVALLGVAAARRFKPR